MDDLDEPFSRLGVNESMLANSIKNISKQTQLWCRSVRVLFSLLLIAFLFSATSAIEAQELQAGSSDKQFKQKGIQSIPFEQLNNETRAKIQPVLEKPSLYRHLPTIAIECDPDYFRYLVRYPEIIVEIWKLMGVTKMDSQRTGPWVVQTNDGAGTISELELVYGNANQHIFYGTGTYEGQLLRKKLGGRCVLVLDTQHGTDEFGNPTAVSQLDVYLKVDNVAAGVIARTLQPIVGPTADHNFKESLRFIQRLNETTVKNGSGVQLMADRLTLDPQVLRGFQDVAGQTYRRGLNRSAAATPEFATEDAQHSVFESR